MRLSLKIAALTTAVVGCSTLGGLWIADRALRAQLVNSLTVSAREVLVESSGAELAALLGRGDESALLPRLQEIQRRLGAEYAAALGPDGKSLAHTHVAEVGRSFAPGKGSGLLSSGLQEWHGRQVLFVTVPVRRHQEDFLDAVAFDENDLAGRLAVGMPLARIDTVRSEVFRLVATAGALLNLLTVLLIVVLFNRMLRPVGLLLKAAARVGSGERGVQVPVLHRDELGELCRGFNSMVVNLDGTTLSRNALNAILSSLQDALVVTDPEGVLLRANPAAEKALGQSSPQLRGRRLAEFVDGLLLGDDGRPLAVQPPDVSLRGADGAVISALMAVSSIKLKSGDVESLVFTFHDITERNKAEKAINRLGRILEESPNEIYVFDAATLRFSMVNASARRNLGYAMDELRELTPLDLKPRFTKDAFEFLISPLRSGASESIRFETDHRRKDGTHYPVEVHLHLSASDASPSFVAIIQDIGERKQLESRMIQSEKLSAVGQLAAGVAHEINNPLGVILGFAQSVIKRMNPGDPFLTPLQAIERESQRCKRLVQNLLTFSRQNQGRGTDSFDLTAAVSDALSLVEVHAKVKSIALSCDKPDKRLSVRGDAQHLQQIVVNLCTNALDAVGQNGRVSVRVRPIPRDGAVWAQIEVADNGPGIPEGIQKRIFEPFFTTKEPGKGTGLGLALVAELVQRHGGSIDLESAPGGGTVFRVEFPSVPGAA